MRLHLVLPQLFPVPIASMLLTCLVPAVVDSSSGEIKTPVGRWKFALCASRNEMYCIAGINVSYVESRLHVLVATFICSDNYPFQPLAYYSTHALVADLS